jgi:hypothetical protein
VVPHFYVLRISLAMFSQQAANEVLGMAQVYGGALTLAEAMVPQPEVVKVLGEVDPLLWVEIRLCQKCFLHGGLNLAELWEQVNNRPGEHQG